MRAPASAVGPASLTPWSAMKNTSAKPGATFEAIPRPNHSAKIGAEITRGMEWAALMYGSRVRAATGGGASHVPTASPVAVPTTNASTVSSSVTHRWP